MANRKIVDNMLILFKKLAMQMYFKCCSNVIVLLVHHIALNTELNILSFKWN